MRVLHILSTLNIGSGIANFVMSHYRKILKYGIQFDFLLFCPVEKGFEEEVEKSGGRVFYISKPDFKHIGSYKKQVKKLFEEHTGEWDAVHIHEILVQKYVTKYAKKCGKVKSVAIHSHASDFVLPTYGVSVLKNKLITAYKRVRNAYLFSGLKRNCDYYFACSDNAGVALYGKKILRNKRYYVIKNAIDCDKYAFNEEIREQYRRELGLKDKKAIILVGRLCEQKNQTFILDVIKKLCDADSSYSLLLVGEGDLRKAIEEKTAALNLENNVTLLGNRTDIPNILCAADLSVLPSLTEGLGIVLIEAQAAGLPCVASTGVPREAKVTPYVKFVDLDVQAWVDAVKSVELKRYDTKGFITESGYNIDEGVKTLSSVYFEMAGVSTPCGKV